MEGEKQKQVILSRKKSNGDDSCGEMNKTKETFMDPLTYCYKPIL